MSVGLVVEWNRWCDEILDRESTSANGLYAVTRPGDRHERIVFDIGENRVTLEATNATVTVVPRNPSLGGGDGIESRESPAGTR